MMKFGIAKAVMTPKEPVFMSGFASRTHKSEGVHDDIYAKAVWLQANEPLLILTFDVLGGDRSFIDGLKGALFEKFALKADQILINFSHTHASVYLTGEDPTKRRGFYSMGQEANYSVEDYTRIDFSTDVAFYHELKESVIQLVQTCIDQAQEGEIQIGLGTSDIPLSRRVVTENDVLWAPNYDAEIDKDLFVLKLVNNQGEMKGILFNIGCHPTSMNNYEISAEFVGYACRYLEAHYPGSEAVFLQGCAGEIKPSKSAHENGEKFKLCTFEEMMEIGRDFADEVMKVIEEGAFRTIEPAFSAKLFEAKLFSQKADAAFYEEQLKDPNLSDTQRTIFSKTLQYMEHGLTRDHLYIHISIWHLDEETRIIALEGEISTEYALKLKKLFPAGKTIVLGYSNGMFTYIATRRMIQDGGYEADRAPMARGFVAPFEEEIEDIIIGRIVNEEILS